MGKIAFVFAGQGAQYPGMGKDLCNNIDGTCPAGNIFMLCDKIKPGTAELCFDGTAEQLHETVNTQPCLFAVESAVSAALTYRGISPDAVAGFSVGELSALCYAGVCDVETMMKAVCRRAELMQKASEKLDTVMFAVLKLTAPEVEKICSGIENCYPVNYNSPGQTVVSCLAEKSETVLSAVREAGGRAVKLDVRGGFHSPFMKEASEGFAEYLKTVLFGKLTIPVYANITAAPYGENISEMLSQQVCSPVKWEDTVRNMISDGIDTFIEIGPGKTLCGLIKRIDSGVRTFAACGADDIRTIINEV